MQFKAACVWACFSAIPLVQAQRLTLAQALNNNANLSNFASLLTSYGEIYANLTFQQGITIFAPSNDAFVKLPYQSLGQAISTNNTEVVRALLSYTVGAGVYPVNAFNTSFRFIPTLLDNAIYSNVTGGSTIGGVLQAGNTFILVSGLGSRSTVLQADIPFANGVIHVLDTFLVPPQSFLQSTDAFNLSSVAGAFDSTKNLSTYVDTHKDLTIFAPKSSALAAVASTLNSLSADDLVRLLEYHVIEGNGQVYYTSNLPNGSTLANGTVYNTTTIRSGLGANLTITFQGNSLFVNSARVVQQDLLLSNGVLHVIDNVLNYNVTQAVPNPELNLQVPQIPGSAVSGGALPFTQALPSSTSVLFALVSSSPTDSAVESTPTTESPAASSPTDGSSRPSSTSKAWGEKLETHSSQMGLVLGALVWIIGFL